MGRQSPSCRTKWSEWDNACHCFLLYILICISLINPQGWYLQFRWNVNSIIFIPGYCYSWHYNKVWGINLIFPKLLNHTPLFENPITTTARLETNPSSQSLSQTSKTNENNLYIVRYIYFFTISNLELLTIRDLKLHNTHLFRPMFLSSLFSYSYFKMFNLEKRNLKETRQSIKTFVAVTSIKTRICQLGSRTCQVNHFFQPHVGQGCVVSLPANKIHNFMEEIH